MSGKSKSGSTAPASPPPSPSPPTGGAATNTWKSTGGTYNVLNNSPYRWTVSKKPTKEIPYILLNEYAVDESTIKTQISYYTTSVADAARNVINDATGNPTDNADLLAPYRQLFPRNPTGNIFVFPYFSDINFEINTPQWASLDTIGEGMNFAENTIGALGGQGAANLFKSVAQGAGAIAGAGLALAYPKIGIMDRPKLWSSHDFRTIQIKFSLFNTVGPDEWKENRSLCWVLVNQNLFTKRDFITGIPPVYYEVIIPGQHYSYASCVTNLTIYNRGNMRTLPDKNGAQCIVPDAYEINMTLTDMVMPSRNLFQSIQKKSSEVVVTQATQNLQPI